MIAPADYPEYGAPEAAHEAAQGCRGHSRQPATSTSGNQWQFIASDRTPFGSNLRGDASIGGQDDERRAWGSRARGEADAERNRRTSLRSQSLGVPYYRLPLTTPARESGRPMRASTA
jgi:hypothetical protein